MWICCAGSEVKIGYTQEQQHRPPWDNHRQPEPVAWDNNNSSYLYDQIKLVLNSVGQHNTKQKQTSFTSIAAATTCLYASQGDEDHCIYHQA